MDVAGRATHRALALPRIFSFKFQQAAAILNGRIAFRPAGCVLVVMMMEPSVCLSPQVADEFVT